MDDRRSDGGAMSAASRRHRPRRATVLLTLLCVVLVAAGASLWLWQRGEHRAADASAARDREVLAAATQEALALGSVDYRKLDEYVAAVKAGATGDFLKQFEAGEASLTKFLTKNKSVNVPTIPDDGVGLIERDGDAARVMVALDAVVTNTSTSKPEPRHYRFLFTLQRVDGTWLTSQLEIL